MSFTRFHDDPARIKYGLQISTYSGRYALDTPGPGINLPYLEDCQVRMQRWGANLMTNPINIESDLRGLTRPLNRDNMELNNYKISLKSLLRRFILYNNIINLWLVKLMKQ